MNQAQHNFRHSAGTDKAGSAAFRRLHALGRVGLHGDACLHLQRSWMDCRRCADACPHGSLTRRDGALELDPARCTGCGLCATSCPTGALAVEGFAFAPPPSASAVTIVCDKAGPDATAGHDGGEVRRVPCLGGLAMHDWLRLALSNGGAPVRMIDDGSCRHCQTARGTDNPGLDGLMSAQRALAASGVASDALPNRVKPQPLPNGNSLLPAPSAPPAAGRRAFFAGLSRAISAGVAQAAVPAIPFAGPRMSASRPRTPIPNVRGDEIRLSLLQIARLHGLAAPGQALLPALVASDACRAHGGCARVCPTGALQLESSADGESARLSFDAWRCIDCGACAAACPSTALGHEARAWRPFVAAPVELAVIEQSECAHCGAQFTTHGGKTLCERCSKAENLARAGFALFGHRHGETPAAPEGP